MYVTICGSEYWVRSDGLGYVYCTDRGPGTLGQQLVNPDGSTVMATADTLERAVRRWRRRRGRWMPGDR